MKVDSEVPGQNGDKPKRRKSKRRHQKGDNPKRRQYQGNITKTATEKCGQNGDKEQRTAQCFILTVAVLVCRRFDCEPTVNELRTELERRVGVITPWQPLVFLLSCEHSYFTTSDCITEETMWKTPNDNAMTCISNEATSRFQHAHIYVCIKHKYV